jgi:hypothetical protein
MDVQAFVSQTLRRPAYLLPVAAGLLVLNLVAISVTGGSRVQTEDKSKNPTSAGEITPGESLAPEAIASASAAAAAAAKKKAGPASGTKAGVDTAITDTEIGVGIAYNTSPGTANAAAGFAGIGQVDQKRAWEIMIGEVNKKAPFGRKVVPVYYTFDDASTQAKGAEQLYQEMCAAWKGKVFLAWAGGLDNLKSCLQKNGIVQIGGGGGFTYAKTFKDFPYYVEHNGAALDRTATFEVHNLFANGFFSRFREDNTVDSGYTPLVPVDRQPKIGLIRYDYPSFDAAAASMKDALASHGLGICDGCEWKVSYSPDNVPAQLDDATEVNSAISNCKARGCTHMLFLGSTAGARITLFYVQRAEDQKFRPMLGFNTFDGADAVRAFYDGSAQQPGIPNSQFRYSVLVATSPGSFNLRGGAFADCKKLFTDAGETFGGSDDKANNKQNQIAGYCDTAWYHIAVFNKVGKSVTKESFINGVTQTGRLTAAGTFLMQTTATRHDGAGIARMGQWFGPGDPDPCRCWRPGGDIPI